MSNPSIQKIKDQIAQLQENIKVIEAFDAGKPIQYFDSTNSKWVDTGDANYTEILRYRVKPEPQFMFVNYYPNQRHGDAYDSQSEAELNASAARIRTAKFVEVIE